MVAFPSRPPSLAANQLPASATKLCLAMFLTLVHFNALVLNVIWLSVFLCFCFPCCFSFRDVLMRACRIAETAGDTSAAHFTSLPDVCFFKSSPSKLMLCSLCFPVVIPIVVLSSHLLHFVSLHMLTRPPVNLAFLFFCVD